MAIGVILRRRLPVATSVAAMAAGMMLTCSRDILAEAPEKQDDASLRKPIYDDMPLVLNSQQDSQPTESSPSKAYAPTPTDRLASQVRNGRLYLHKYAVKAEDATNDALTETLRLEHSFTSTIASLAPPRGSGERIMPGALYVLVATMAGSILTRNRSIFLRASVPVAVGIGAAQYVLPITSRNVGDLIWKYEERYPFIAENHIKIKDRVTRFWQTGVAHSKMSLGVLEDKVGETRESVEEWVKKGK